MQKPYNTNIQESATNSFCIDQSGVAEIGREELRAKEFESLRKNQSRIYPKSKSYTWKQPTTFQVMAKLQV
jgi:hypothetical protein